MLGLILLYVGVVLILNGFARLYKISDKSAAVMNFFTGGLSALGNLIVIIAGEITGHNGDFYAAATGLLFGFTYLYIGFNTVFNLDLRLYGWYSFFVACNAIPAGIYSVWGANFYNPFSWLFAIIWWLWAALWLTAWIENNMKQPLGNFVGYLAIFEGIFTAWIPGVLLLLGLWH